MKFATVLAIASFTLSSTANFIFRNGGTVRGLDRRVEQNGLKATSSYSSLKSSIKPVASTKVVTVPETSKTVVAPTSSMSSLRYHNTKHSKIAVVTKPAPSSPHRIASSESHKAEPSQTEKTSSSKEAIVTKSTSSAAHQISASSSHREESKTSNIRHHHSKHNDTHTHVKHNTVTTIKLSLTTARPTRSPTSKIPDTCKEPSRLYCCTSPKLKENGISLPLPRVYTCTKDRSGCLGTGICCSGSGKPDLKNCTGAGNLTGSVFYVSSD